MSKVYDMAFDQWRQWFKDTTGRYPTMLDTHDMLQHMKDYDGPVEKYGGTEENT